MKMKKTILRNIAIVSAIFIVTFSIMLITNYFQVRESTPLQTEVMETLKEINDRNADNPALQEQIRQLDLLARKAYFGRMEHLMTGVYILLGMIAIFIICTRYYFAGDKDLPDKDIDPIDEWAIKTKARRYVVWATIGSAAVALLFVLLSSPYLKSAGNKTSETNTEHLTIQANAIHESSAISNEVVAINESEPTSAGAPDVETTAETADSEAPAEAAPQPAVTSQVNHSNFRGPNANGISSAKGLPVQWDLSNDTNIAWKKDIPRKGYNSPVIHGNKVFFTGGDEEARELFGYDLTTGEQLWKLAAANIPGSPTSLPNISDDTGWAASTAATNGNAVCAMFANGDIICADMNGKLLWAKNMGNPEINYGFASSLLIYGNTVIVQYDVRNSPRVVALDLSNGAERWSKARNEEQAWSSPMIATINNTPKLVLMGNRNIIAYNPNSGEELWKTPFRCSEVATTACYADGIVFGTNEYAKTLAISGVDGSIIWESNEFLPEIASPVATKDNLYVATSYGVVAAYNAKTGEIRKEHELIKDFNSSPTIADGKIYLFCTDGNVFIFSADNDFNLLHTFETGEKTFASPAFTDGKIVIRTEKSIYCVVNK
jgi:outer membrane protein assembly factor BamB